MDYTSLVLSQCRSISLRVFEAKVLKKRCRQLGDTISSVESLVQAFQQRATTTVSPQVGRALQRLYTTLIMAENLVQKCISNRVVNTVKYKSDFNTVEHQIKDSLRVLATVPHVSQGPSVSRAPEYTVEEAGDGSDDDLGALLPYLSGATGPRMPAFSLQPSVVCETVMMVENGTLIYAERVSGALPW